MTKETQQNSVDNVGNTIQQDAKQPTTVLHNVWDEKTNEKTALTHNRVNVPASDGIYADKVKVSLRRASGRNYWSVFLKESGDFFWRKTKEFLTIVVADLESGRKKCPISKAGVSQL